MSSLTGYHQDQPASHIIDTDNGAAIAQELNAVGVRFERWPATRSLDAKATPEEIGEVTGPKSNGCRTTRAIKPGT